MSRTNLISNRRRRAVCHRPAPDTRLLPSPHSHLDHSLGWGIPLALSEVEGSQERNGRGLLLIADLVLPISTPTTSAAPGPNASASAAINHRPAPCMEGPRTNQGTPCCRAAASASAPPSREHTYVADVVLAGESQQSDERRLKTNAPFKDSTVVTTGELPTTNAGLGSPLPSLGMVEHFWWSRLPHTEIPSRLLHILSEVRGCRRVVADVEHPLWRTIRIGTCRRRRHSCATVRDLPSPPPLPL